MQDRDAQALESFQRAKILAQELRLLIEAEQFHQTVAKASFRPDDCAFTFRFTREDRTVIFCCGPVTTAFHRIGKDSKGLYRVWDGAVLDQRDQYQLLRWVEQDFPSQVPEARQFS